ncbi:guanine nucleotide exchange protein SMCR8-like [Melanotaenia boesemani]|uniref:guanine nucleotide exchange protein SMCR8-like n=1 Tax=Melanotaenia boesemani TaxID=1250792 RepID=UPI001C054812|nr:guanine nucleotide exchange protein SMCR8-like [Melanotaenia boesemani]
MIGSPDLLAFTGTEGFGEGGEEQEAQSLPEDLSVPLFPYFHPWTTRAQFHRDFILVAEFSEQVGPKPVLTIPDDQKVIGSFDLNHFSVRIMSVDYQASGPCHAPPSSPGPRLNFSEDSKVILGDSAHDAFAYVHHLTLYDLEARGMVRPFCMAYVSSDQTKLMENFAELSACFSQASDSLKTGNRQAFSTELQQKLQVLEYRRLSLLQETEPQRTANESTEVDSKGDELEAVERLILNHRELLRQVTSYPNRKLKQPDFLPYDPADSLTDLTVLPDTSSSLSTSTSCKSEHRLKPLQELCNTYFLSLMKEQLVDTERRLRGDRSVLRTTRITRSLSRQLKFTNFLFELLSPEDVEEMEAEGAEVEQHGFSNRKGDLDRVQSEPQSLESFLSCVEEIPIKLEVVEAETVTPDPTAPTEMTGSVSSGDSIEVLGTEKSYRTQRIIVGSDSRETPVGVTDVCIRRAPVDAGVRRVRACAKRANSEDSIEVLSTTESIFPDDLTAITEEESELHPLTNGFEEESQTGCHKDLDVEKAANSENELELEGSVKEPSKEIMVSGGVMTKEDSNLESKNEVHEDTTPERTCQLLQVSAQSASQWPKTHQRVKLVPHLYVNVAPPVALLDSDQRSPPCTPLRLLSVDEMSDCISFTSSSDPPSPTQNNQSKIHLEKRRRRKAGLRALRFIKQHSYSQHAVYCLLSGRPLVVIGGDESLVRKLVGALSLFLPAPGPDGSAVMPCLATPLQLIDLLTWRLIGIHRSSSSSSATILHSLSRYGRYLALLDLDQRTLRSPSYSGSLISVLTSPHTGISRGITYLLHVESCLTALSNQVLLQTFAPVLRCPNTTVGERSAEEKEAQGFSGSESDLRVMHFLSDLIKQHHAGRGPPVLRFSYCSVHLHRNTNAT